MAKLVKVKGLEKTIRNFRIRRQKTNESLRQELQDSAEDLQTLAKRMSLRDTGALESAIVIDELKDNFARLKIAVAIDANVVRIKPGFPTQKVGEYAYMVHQQKTPFGPIPLGPPSQRKQDEETVTVGGGFMTRAYEELYGESQETFFDKFKKAVKRALTL